MNLFCEDRDLAVWEPTAFTEPAVAPLALVRGAAATVAGTAVTTAGAALGAVAPGMVAVIRKGAGDAAVEAVTVVTAVAAADAMSVSVLRAPGEPPAGPPGVDGDATVTVVSFRALIAAVGDEVLALLGVAPGALGGASQVLGLKAAVVFGALAAVYRAAGPSARADAKLALYTRYYQIARRAIAGAVDADGDGVAETPVGAAVTTWERV
jgi:hypothetical protein